MCINCFQLIEFYSLFSNPFLDLIVDWSLLVAVSWVANIAVSFTYTVDRSQDLLKSEYSVFCLNLKNLPDR